MSRVVSLGGVVESSDVASGIGRFDRVRLRMKVYHNSNVNRVKRSGPATSEEVADRRWRGADRWEEHEE